MAELRSSDVLSKVVNTYSRMCELNIPVEKTTLNDEVDITVELWVEEESSITPSGGRVVDYTSTVAISCGFKYITNITLTWNNYNGIKQPQLETGDLKGQKLILKIRIANVSSSPGKCEGTLNITYQEYRYPIQDFMPYSLRQTHKQGALYNIHGQIGSIFLYPYGQDVSLGTRLDVPPNLISYYSILDLTQQHSSIGLAGDSGGSLYCRINNKDNKYTIDGVDMDETQFEGKTIKIKFFLMPYEAW